VELSGQIRRDKRAGGSSIRELAEMHHVHRRAVRQALASAVPPPQRAYPQRPRPAIDAYAAVIDSWLLADQGVPRKQRHTARRVWQRLVADRARRWRRSRCRGMPRAATSSCAWTGPGWPCRRRTCRVGLIRFGRQVS
jgi:hypothetical protein